MSRYMYECSKDQLKHQNDAALFTSINLLQDAVELFFLSIAEKFNIPLSKKTEFTQYIQKIDEFASPYKIPVQYKLIQLNKIRVASKHDGIKPDVAVLQELLIVVKEIFIDVTKNLLKADFFTINLLDSLGNDEKKFLLEKAQQAIIDKDWSNCLTICRKVFFIEFEEKYSIERYLKYSDIAPYNLIRSLNSSAPEHARSKDYIDQNVKEPYDYIVLDHAKIDTEILKDGIDPVIFWNIWRLTPQVYRYEDKTWAEKNDLEKLNPLDPEGAQERACYVFQNLANIILLRHRRRKNQKGIWRETGYTVNLKSMNTPVYAKADENSKIVDYIPKNTSQVVVDYSTVGLNKEGCYWFISLLKTPTILVLLVDIFQIMM